MPFSPYNAVKLAHCAHPSYWFALLTPPSMRSPETVTPAGTPTRPPPSDAGQLPLFGRRFISLMAQMFFSNEVVRFDPVPESWPRCVSDAENQVKDDAAAVAPMQSEEARRTGSICAGGILQAAEQ